MSLPERFIVAFQVRSSGKTALSAYTAPQKSQQLCKKPLPPRHSIVFRTEFSSTTTQLHTMKLGPSPCTPPSFSQLQRRCPASFFHFQTCRGLRAHPGAARAGWNAGARTFLGSNRRVETSAPIQPRRRRDPSRPSTLPERPGRGGRAGLSAPWCWPQRYFFKCWMS